MTVGPFHAGLADLITRLWARGIPVTAWCETADKVVLLCTDGHEIQVERRRLGSNVEELAQAIAAWWPWPRPRVLETPQSATLVPQVSERTLAWWRFLRWSLERGQLECPVRHPERVR